MKRTLLTLASLGILYLATFMAVGYSDKNKSQLTEDVFKCPEEYATPGEYIDALAAFIMKSEGSSLSVTLEELLVIRKNQFQEHGCKGRNDVENDLYLKSPLPSPEESPKENLSGSTSKIATISLRQTRKLSV
jgi:hypothetical protein